MTNEEILAAMKARLTELDTEAAKLRAGIAALEGKAAEPVYVPTVMPPIPYPMVPNLPYPFAQPWWEVFPCVPTPTPLEWWIGTAPGTVVTTGILTASFGPISTGCDLKLQS